jgi:hypothetical protein
VKKLNLQTSLKKTDKFCGLCCGLCCLNGFIFSHTVKDQKGTEIAKFVENYKIPDDSCCTKYCSCCSCCCCCCSCCCSCVCCQCLKECKDIYIYEYQPRSYSEGHIFRQHAKIEIVSTNGGNSIGKLLHGDTIQGNSERNRVTNFNRCRLCMLKPVYSNVS